MMHYVTVTVRSSRRARCSRVCTHQERSNKRAGRGDNIGGREREQSMLDESVAGNTRPRLWRKCQGYKSSEEETTWPCSSGQHGMPGTIGGR